MPCNDTVPSLIHTHKHQNLRNTHTNTDTINCITTVCSSVQVPKIYTKLSLAHTKDVLKRQAMFIAHRVYIVVEDATLALTIFRDKA